MLVTRLKDVIKDLQFRDPNNLYGAPSVRYLVPFLLGSIATFAYRLPH